MANWSWLPCDLLSEIASKLDTLKDFVYFSAVCHSFNRACSMVKPMFYAKLIPWLMLAENTKDNPECRRDLFSLSGKRWLQLKLPQTFGARCWGSSCGWIVTFNANLQLHLFNPLTQAQISLPPHSTMPNQPTDKHEYPSHEEFVQWVQLFFVIKAVVVEVAPGDIFVLALGPYLKNTTLFFARPGDEKWTEVFNSEDCPVADVCWDGHRRVYILYEDGNLSYFDISEACSSSQPVIAVGDLNLGPLLALQKKYYKRYIVESFGDLFIVLRDSNGKGPPNPEAEYYCTTGFEVNRLDIGLKKWERLNDLGDVALFVGDSQSMSVHACGDCKRNSIYFTDDDMELWGMTVGFGPVGGHDMGIFDMQSGKIERKFFDEKIIHSDLCTPFWFVPRF